jgi:hypothetical protein
MSYWRVIIYSSLWVRSVERAAGLALRLSKCASPSSSCSTFSHSLRHCAIFSSSNSLSLPLEAPTSRLNTSPSCPTDLLVITRYRLNVTSFASSSSLSISYRPLNCSFSRYSCFNFSYRFCLSRSNCSSSP